MENTFAFFKKSFAREEPQQQQQQQQQIVVQQNQQTRPLYQRKENRTLENIQRIEDKITQCDTNIQRLYTQLAADENEIKGLKKQLNGLKDKNGTQAMGIKTKAAQIMQRGENITKKRITTQEQLKLTLSTQLENVRGVNEAREVDELIRETNIEMKTTLESMNLSTVQGTASDARRTLDQASHITSLVFNPFDMTPDENNASFIDQFNALELIDTESEEEQQQRFNSSNKKNIVSSPSSSKPKVGATVLLDEDFY